MKFISIFFVILILSGCSPAPEKGTPAFSPKILSLSAAATGILMQLDFPPVAIDEYGIPAAGDEALPVVGKGSAVSMEKVTELGCNTAILWYYQKDVARMFRNSGLQVFELPAIRFSSYPDLIRRIGLLTGKIQEAEELCRKFEHLRQDPGKGEKIPVYFELYAPWKSAGEESYIGDLLSVAGGKPISRKSGLLNAEYILEQNPEVIFFVEDFISPEQMEKRPGFREISAVKNHRLYPVPRRFVMEGVALEEAVSFFKEKLSQGD